MKFYISNSLLIPLMQKGKEPWMDDKKLTRSLYSGKESSDKIKKLPCKTEIDEIGSSERKTTDE